MPLGSDTLLIVKLEGERVGEEISIGREGFIRSRPRGLGIILCFGVIEALSEIKRELHSSLVSRPYGRLLLYQTGHRHRHQILSSLSSSILASKSRDVYLGED
jgi:hypothetical protein